MTRSDLLEAYRQTSFLAHTPGGAICIRIGQIAPDLESLLENENRCWAYVTAWNPGSIPLSDEENRTHQRELEHAVRQAGYTVFPGEGVGQDGAWPPEPSLLILGISLEDAIELGRRFGQAAIVAGRSSEPAELILC